MNNIGTNIKACCSLIKHTVEDNVDIAKIRIKSIWNKNIKQDFWQDTIKTKVINNTIKPLPGNVKNFLYTGNEEYWDWKNIATILGGLALSILFVAGGVALLGTPASPILGLAGFGIFLGGCKIAQHRLKKSFNETAWDDVKAIREEVNKLDEKNPDYTEINRLKLELNPKNKKRAHLNDEIEQLKRIIESLEDPKSERKDLKLDDRKKQAINQIENILTSINKNKPIPALT
jgi:hypothetical protein